MTSILERAIGYVKAHGGMSAGEVNDLIARDVEQGITGDEFARLLASGAFKSAASANVSTGIKHEVIPAGAPRIHKVVIEDNCLTEDFV